MRVAAAGIVFCLVCASSGARAGEQILYGPPAAWVRPVPLPAATPAGPAEASYQLLLSDIQQRFTAAGEEAFAEAVVRIASAEALSQGGNLIQTWQPDTDTVIIHHMRLLRGSQVIDLLAGGRKPTVIRRETNLESAMLDGQLTATLQPEDLRVGDILDVAVTVRRKDPALQGRAESGLATSHRGVASRVYLRTSWSADKSVRWKASPDLGQPVVTRTGEGTEVVFDLHDLVTPDAPKGAPGRFAYVGYLQASEFRDWAEVSAIASPLFEKAARLGPDSPLRAEVARIKAAHPDPEGRAMAALRLVQDQVRYVYIGLNYGGYVPAEADLTWKRRFADCKGKTALLLALLRELGVQSTPALVSTSGGDGLDQRLPMLRAFDHVLVRAVIGGKVYWMDGTRIGDRRMSDLPVPDYRWALPLSAAGTGLERLVPRDPAEPLLEKRVVFDLTPGLAKPAKVHIEEVFRGDAAVALHSGLSGGQADSDRALRKFWTDAYDWVAIKSVGFSFDETAREARLTLDGEGPPHWSKDGQLRELWLDDTEVGFNASFKRQPGPDPDVPFAVDYPSLIRNSVTVRLPADAPLITLLNAGAVDETVAGVAYHRSAKRTGDTVLVETATHSVAPEFPAAQADAAETRLDEMWRHDVALRYSDSAPPEAEADNAPDPALDSTPHDAVGFARRGSARLKAGDLAKAIADFDEAVRREPTSAKYVYNRGVAQAKAGHDEAALADFGQAIKLTPGDKLALLARGQLRLARGDKGGAQRDFDAAIAASPADAQLFEKVGSAYGRRSLYAEALPYYDRWAEVAAADEKAVALNNACWARAVLNRELDKALAQCGQSLRLAPDTAGTLDSRGLVQLRRGRLDESIADYDTALRLSPQEGSSLYGRGLAELAKGRKAAADKDLAAAKAVDPALPARFASWGLKP